MHYGPVAYVTANSVCVRKESSRARGEQEHSVWSVLVSYEKVFAVWVLNKNNSSYKITQTTQATQ